MVDRRINAFLVVIAATVVIQLLDYQHVSMLQTSLFFNENTLKQAYAYSAETSLTNSTKTNTTVSETNLLAPQTMGTVGLTLSKEYPAIFFPMEQEYVRYDLRIINLGTTELQNQVLWTRFTSDSARTLHESKYALPDLHPGDSALLHIGPLKMHDTSEHMLFVGINRNGDSGLPNEVSMLGVSPGMPIDSFQVFGQETLERIVIGSVISVSGLGIIITYLVFWRSKKNIIKR